MVDIICTRDDIKCNDCPIIKECEHIQLTEEIDAYSLYEKGRADAIAEFKDLGKLYSEIRADAIDEAIHHLDNCTTNCHEDYIDGIHFSMGVLEELKEQK